MVEVAKETPMIKQYLSIKENHLDSILFYRMGDFFEMFFDDAVTASKVLDIALTSRNKSDNIPIPMCGVPARAADNYIGKLVNSGYKVAVCEQVEDAAEAKGLVKREVIKIVTPGMILDGSLLDEKTNNYIMSISSFNNALGISYLDISTGEFRLTESSDIKAIIDEAARIAPNEILIPESLKADSRILNIIKIFSEKRIGYLSDFYFDIAKGRELIIEHFKTRSLEGFGCENLKAGISAAAALINYVIETQKQQIEHLKGIETYFLDNYLIIDDLTCKNLELIANLRSGSRQGTLIDFIDQTVTSLGARLIKKWMRYPLRYKQNIQERLDAIEEALNKSQSRKNIRNSLKSISDMERLLSRISMNQSNGRDLISLKNSLKKLPEIFSEILNFNSVLYKFDINLNGLEEVSNLIESVIREDAPPCLNEGGIIKSGCSNELDELIQISQDSKIYLAKLEIQEREKTGINTLKVRYNKVFGYYIEVSKGQSKLVPHHYVRKQTLVNAERYITDELKKFESKVLGAEEKRIALEYEIFTNIRKEVLKYSSDILSVASFLANIDCLLSLSETAALNDYSKPEITTNGEIIIEEGRHPVVEKMITAERFVPNGIKLDNVENQIIIITGPNMAGKSTILRQTALIVLLSHIGSFVPAKKASISLTDRIFTRVGALDNLSHGQSTFMVEMEETANILNNATSQSLVIIDEIGRGTSTFDGMSIAWAVAEYLHDLKSKGVKTLFATHYHELTELEGKKARVKNFNIAVREINDEIVFLRKLIEGGTNKSYGIQVARLAGMPKKVINRAKQILFKIEKKDDLRDSLNSKATDDSINKKEIQLSLFSAKEQIIVEQLKDIDVLAITPLEALNILNELQNKANKI
ncbi:MAG: DNA mismatch repair protein MutS [Desulfobacterales bacterium]|nr:DNA mismatch repair protein MutS [Desulfobacterales bacterium]